jgi:hypothetical protein
VLQLSKKPKLQHMILSDENLESYSREVVTKLLNESANQWFQFYCTIN